MPMQARLGILLVPSIAFLLTFWDIGGSAVASPQAPQGTDLNKSTAANAVQQQTLKGDSVIVWAPKGCDVCEGFLDRVDLPNSNRPFIERAYGAFFATQVCPMREGDSLVVAVSVSVAVSANQEASVGDLTENVTVEVAGSDMILHSLPYADPAASTQLKEKRLLPGNVTVKQGEYVQGFLFFPWYNSIKSIIVVVRIPGQIFRFPFVRDSSSPRLFAAPAADAKVPAKEPSSQTVKENATHKENPVPEQAATNRVSFACADEFGVHLCVPGWVSNWVNKNQEKFHDLSFSQAPTPNGRNYLVVFSSSERVFSGFDAVVTHSTSTNMVPVTGTGTVVDNGYAWTFSFNGMATVTTTTTTDESVPYSIQTKTSFVRVYDGHGALISEHQRRVSTRQGGDSANSIGYNSVAIVAAILRRNGVLLNETMKDIEKTLR
ncbi:MAG: hypothetical protein ACHQIK_15105 [Candidatus Acidiferrales bacterium]